MPDSILVAYATRHGSTREVAFAIAAALREQGLEASVRPAADVVTLRGYDGVVLGGALYTGRLHGDARRFLRRHRAALATLPLAVFAIGPRTLAPADVAGSRSQLERALAAGPGLQPLSTAIFGGVIDPKTLHFPLNRIPPSDARDWPAIGAWANALAARFTLAAAAA